MLKEQEEVKWTLFNTGWLADYFVPKEYTYMKPIPLEFPVDANGWRAIVRGTGDEGQSWTCARDVARAVVELCKAEKWVSGWKCFSGIVPSLTLKPSGPLEIQFSVDAVLTDTPGKSYIRSRRMEHIQCCNQDYGIFLR